MGQFRHHHHGKTRTMALFWLHTSYHAQCYMFQRYMLRSLLRQSFNIVITPIILLFSKKWAPGFAAEDNSEDCQNVTLQFSEWKHEMEAQDCGVLGKTQHQT